LIWQATSEPPITFERCALIIITFIDEIPG
jgi:hypothetical protein